MEIILTELVLKNNFTIYKNLSKVMKRIYMFNIIVPKKKLLHMYLKMMNVKKMFINIDCLKIIALRCLEIILDLYVSLCQHDLNLLYFLYFYV